MTTRAFRKDLTSLINFHSMETESGTPDFALADFLCGCLREYNTTVGERELLAGRATKPAHTQEPNHD